MDSVEAISDQPKQSGRREGRHAIGHQQQSSAAGSLEGSKQQRSVLLLACRVVEIFDARDWSYVFCGDEVATGRCDGRDPPRFDAAARVGGPVRGPWVGAGVRAMP
jgi:hypothetical protein